LASRTIAEPDDALGLRGRGQARDGHADALGQARQPHSVGEGSLGVRLGALALLALLGDGWQAPPGGHIGSWPAGERGVGFADERMGSWTAADRGPDPAPASASGHGRLTSAARAAPTSAGA